MWKQEDVEPPHVAAKTDPSASKEQILLHIIYSMNMWDICNSSCPIKTADGETYLLDNKVADDQMTLHMAGSLWTYDSTRLIF